MRLIKLTDGDRVVVGIVHDAGRVERLFDMEAQSCAHLADRIVNAVNACDGISQRTLELLANGSPSGTIAERVTAWALFAGRARPSALRLMEEAKRAIAKQGGSV